MYFQFNKKADIPLKNEMEANTKCSIMPLLNRTVFEKAEVTLTIKMETTHIISWDIYGGLTRR